MASSAHHHYSNMDKKMRTHKRSPSSSSSSSSSTSSSTSSSSSSSDSSSSRRHLSGSGSRRSEGKHKSRSAKRPSSSNDRSKTKLKKSSSSSRKHGGSKSSRKSSHSRSKDYDKNRAHKAARSPSYHKSSGRSKKQTGSTFSHKSSKVSMGPGMSGSDRKSRKASPSPNKANKNRKRSVSPRDRFDYRGDKMAINETSMSHSRDGSITSISSNRLRDPRTDDRLRRPVSPNERYRVESPPRRYEKERVEEFIDPRRERRMSPNTRARDLERKDSHRHRDYEKHDREHYDERKREDVRREEREARDREAVREREVLRERTMVKDRERPVIMDREQERDRERIREPEDRRVAARYGRPDSEFNRERDVMVKGHEFEPDREFYPRNRPDIEPIGSAVEDRHQFEDAPFNRYGERERGRYESNVRGRYDEIPPHERRPSGGNIPGYSPIDDQRRLEDRRLRTTTSSSSLEGRIPPEERRRPGAPVDPRASAHHEGWIEDRRASGGASNSGTGVVDRLSQDREHHFGPGYHHHHHHHPQGPPMHRRHHQGEWGPGGPNTKMPPPSVMWERHKHPRHEEWGEEYGSHSSEWMEEMREWADGGDRSIPPGHDDQWTPHPRRGMYRDDWAGGRGDWGPPDRMQIPGPNNRPQGGPRDKAALATATSRRGRRSDDHSAGRHIGMEDDGSLASPAQEQEQTGNAGFIGDEGGAPKRSLPSDSNQELNTTTAKRPRVDNVAVTSPTVANLPPSATTTANIQDKDNFSDFSDDSDDILNQEVVLPEEETTQISAAGSLPNEESKIQVVDKEPTYEELLDDDDLEEISDEELEEEKQAKFSVADVLDINWASLMDTKPVPTTEAPTDSALKRFRSINILSRIGVSTKYARKEVIDKVVESCKKAAITANNGDEDEKLPEVNPICNSEGVLRILKTQAETRRQKMLHIGTHRRALCARQDLALRHLYCNLPEQDLGEPQYFDKELFMQATSLLTSC